MKFLIFRFYELTSSLHLLTLYRAFVAADAACLRLFEFVLLTLHYITLVHWSVIGGYWVVTFEARTCV